VSDNAMLAGCNVGFDYCFKEEKIIFSRKTSLYRKLKSNLAMDISIGLPRILSSNSSK
jgi:hypothetical protein